MTSKHWHTASLLNYLSLLQFSPLQSASLLSSTHILSISQLIWSHAFEYYLSSNGSQIYTSISDSFISDPKSSLNFEFTFTAYLVDASVCLMGISNLTYPNFQLPSTLYLFSLRAPTLSKLHHLYFSCWSKKLCSIFLLCSFHHNP